MENSCFLIKKTQSVKLFNNAKLNSIMMVKVRKRAAEMRRLAMQNEAVLRFMHLRGIQYILGALHAHL